MKLKKIFLWAVMLICLFAGIISLTVMNINISNAQKTDESSASQQYVSPVKQEVFHKSVEVEITDIKESWRSNKICKWAVTVKSNEYGLENTFEEFTDAMNSSAYGYELYCGKLHVGDKIKAQLLTWKTGDNIDKRQLNNLVK